MQLLITITWAGICPSCKCRWSWVERRPVGGMTALEVALKVLADGEPQPKAPFWEVGHVCGWWGSPRLLCLEKTFSDASAPHVETSPAPAADECGIQARITLTRVRVEVHQMIECVEKRPEMIGGSLMGIETAWHLLSQIKAALDGDPEDDIAREAYRKVAEKYDCGCWVLASKVKDEFKNKSEYPETDHEAAVELVRRLKEVDVLVLEMRARATETKA